MRKVVYKSFFNRPGNLKGCDLGQDDVSANSGADNVSDSSPAPLPTASANEPGADPTITPKRWRRRHGNTMNFAMLGGMFIIIMALILKR